MHSWWKWKTTKSFLWIGKSGHVDLLFYRNSLAALFVFIMEKLMFVVRSLKKRSVISSENLLWHGNEDFHWKMLHRLEKQIKLAKKSKCLGAYCMHMEYICQRKPENLQCIREKPPDLTFHFHSLSFNKIRFVLKSEVHPTWMVIGSNFLWSVVWGFLLDVLLKGSNRFCSSLCFVAFAIAFIVMLLVHSSFPLYFFLAHCPAWTFLYIVSECSWFAEVLVFIHDHVEDSFHLILKSLFCSQWCKSSKWDDHYVFVPITCL